MQLPHRYRRRGHAWVGAADLGDARGEAFEAVVLLGFHDPADGLRHGRVVDGIGETVTLARLAEVDVELHVDFQRLGAGLLPLQHAVDTELTEACDDDLAHIDLLPTCRAYDAWDADIELLQDRAEPELGGGGAELGGVSVVFDREDRLAAVDERLVFPALFELEAL